MRKAWLAGERLNLLAAAFHYRRGDACRELISWAAVEIRALFEGRR